MTVYYITLGSSSARIDSGTTANVSRTVTLTGGTPYVPSQIVYSGFYVDNGRASAETDWEKRKILLRREVYEQNSLLSRGRLQEGRRHDDLVPRCPFRRKQYPREHRAMRSRPGLAKLVRQRREVKKQAKVLAT